MRPRINPHGRWIRLYLRVLDDPKVQTLSDANFRTWVNLLLVAGADDGALPSLRDIAFKLRLPEKEAKKRMEALIAARLVDRTDTGFVPHDWDEMQFRSDGSAERMRRFRARHSDVTGDGPLRHEAVTGDEISSVSVSESVSESSYQGLDRSRDKFSTNKGEG